MWAIFHYKGSNFIRALHVHVGITKACTFNPSQVQFSWEEFIKMLENLGSSKVKESPNLGNHFLSREIEEPEAESRKSKLQLSASVFRTQYKVHSLICEAESFHNHLLRTMLQKHTLYMSGGGFRISGKDSGDSHLSSFTEEKAFFRTLHGPPLS